MSKELKRPKESNYKIGESDKYWRDFVLYTNQLESKFKEVEDLLKDSEHEAGMYKPYFDKYREANSKLKEAEEIAESKSVIQAAFLKASRNDNAKLRSKLKEAEEGEEKLLIDFLTFQYPDEKFDEGDKLMVKDFLKDRNVCSYCGEDL